MDPRIKTFLKILLGAVSVGAAHVFADPGSFSAFGSISLVLVAVGQIVANWLEKLGGGSPA